MKNKPYKKVGKRNSISLAMPDNFNRTRVKSITYTMQGVIDNMNCPACEGDGHSLQDNTNASGGEMIPHLCEFCDGNGKINEEMVKEIIFNHEGEPVIIYKNDKNDENIKHF